MNASLKILEHTGPVPCPYCQKPFRLPEGFSEAHSLACPHCEEMISGTAISEALVPTAKIVDTPSSSDSPTTEAPEIRNAARSFDEEDFTIPKPLKTATRRHRSGERRSGRSSHRKKKSSSRDYSFQNKTNPMAEFVRIVLGGLLALPVAQLVLWWGFLADPVGLAKPTSEVLPFAVPAKLKPNENVSKSEPSEPTNQDMPPNQKLNDNNVPQQIKKLP